MSAGDAEFMAKHQASLEEISKVLAKQIPPTYELFMALSKMFAALLTQHEGALEQIAKTKRNADKRDRRASH